MITDFVFKLQAFFTKKKWILIQNIYKGCPLLDKKTYSWKTKAVIFKANIFFRYVQA